MTFEPIKFTILGEPASKANSRRMVMFGRRPAFIKSQKALDYLSSLKLQVKPRIPLISTDIVFEARVFYHSRRPDLDVSVILDGLQGIIYINDRQCKVIHTEWYLDPANPRAEITISPDNRDG